jgi:hypothetical protein
MSAAELKRFCEAAEKVAAAAVDLTHLSRAMADLVADLTAAIPRRRKKPAEPVAEPANGEAAQLPG